MTIKSKISLYISIIFTILFSVVSFFIVTNFSNFRKDEFENRLQERAMSVIKLLVELGGPDVDGVKIIDQTKIHDLYDEKVLVFDPDYNLIYSNQEDIKIVWSTEDLKELEEKETFFKRVGEDEIYGVFYDTDNEDYFALISANDNLGKRKLNYLISTIIIAGLIFIPAIWLITFYIVKNQLKPLNVFHANVKSINDLNKEVKLDVKEGLKNEISKLAKEFNHMIDRISDVYVGQKEFNAHISHELRTPLARISAQLENKIKTQTGQDNALLKNLLEDVSRLRELTDSLLILSKTDNQTKSSLEKIRIDESIFNAFDKVSAIYSDIKLSFEMNIGEEEANRLIVNARQDLLEIAFENLIRNAYHYSDNHIVKIELTAKNGQSIIKITNDGKLLTEEEANHLFKPFFRGENSNKQTGIGLGLRIADRIFSSFEMSLTYDNSNGLNNFIIST